MDTNTNKVTLGAREYTLVPQPHAVILRKFPKVFADAQDLGSMEIDSIDGVIMLLGDRVYDALKLFIPNLMSKHEYHGFVSQEAMDAGSFDEGYAMEHAPTLPQVFDAFETAMEVNGGKRLTALLGKALGPEVSRAMRSFVVAQMRVRLSEMSLNSPSQQGGSETSTPSGTTPPTLDTPTDLESVGSPSLVSST